MTREEIVKRMEEIEGIRFYINMIDFQTFQDKEDDRKLYREWLELKEKLEKI